MKKLVNVVMLPTQDKKAPILSYLEDKKIQYYPKENWSNNDLSKRHLYLTSNEEIKEDSNGFKYFIGLDNKVYLWNGIVGTYKVIIATTDKLFTKEDIFSPILPQIPESFIKAYIEAQGNIKEVTLEWMNGGDNKYYNAPKTRDDNTVIIHRAKTYTREEVLNIIAKRDIHHFNNSIDTLNAQSPEQWMNSNNL